MSDNDVPNLRKTPSAYRQRNVETLPTGDAKVDDLQEKMRKSIDDINDTCPILRGRHVIPMINGDFWIPAGATVTVEHGLGRQIRGWMVHDVIGGPNLLERMQYGNEDKILSLKNNHTGAIACALWVW